jgi:hypothetical protein
MIPRHFISFGAIVSIIAGILTIAFWFFHPNPDLSNLGARLLPGWSNSYATFILIIVLTLFALPVQYLSAWKEFKGLGFVSFILAFIGTALFVGAGFIDAYVTPVLAQSDATRFLLAMDSSLFKTLIPTLMFGGIAFAIGYVLFGVSVIRSKKFSLWIGILFILGAPVLGLSPLMPAIARTLGSIVWGIANVWMGISLQKLSHEVEKVS